MDLLETVESKDHRDQLEWMEKLDQKATRGHVESPAGKETSDDQELMVPMD